VTEHENILEIIRRKDQTPISLTHATALLVIDMQRYFVRPQYQFGQIFEKLLPGATVGYFERVRASVVPNIKRLQAYFRSQRLPIFYTACGSWTEDGRDLPQWMKEFDHLGLDLLGKRIWPPPSDPSWQVDDSLAPGAGEVVLNKPSSGVFTSTKLDETLHNMEVESLIVTGVTTSVCVGLGARQAADRGFQVIIAEDACTELSEELHRGALQSFALAFGRVRNTDELLNLNLIS
jgi:nicotinamidase-related amidase